MFPGISVAGAAQQHVSALLKGEMTMLSLRMAATLFFSISNSFAAGTEPECGGISTPLYSESNLTLTICHGPETKIDRSRLNEWQYCGDAKIQAREKGSAKTTEYVDCTPMAPKQFTIRGKSLFIKHFLTTYPGFEKKPILVETIELNTKKQKWEFVGKIAPPSKEDFEKAIKQIDSALAKPFDGETFFTSVYSGFFVLRDYATVDPYSVLIVLQNYQKRGGRIDGEVAETLSEVIGEVKIIYAAHKKR